ncbi:MULTISPECIES: YtxH domain-containing protein [Clostridium]|uniref:YtxH domain-containing protein n=1 Tax=Clostridium frigoriphilum TaxID=443253 RepID=A0ABU7USH2_9CLOT|nr:YtxH domain-containing protein [Clostridium sp. DSM 17811]MBU3101230.1 YtxH domain-containing protein [Clostridium sp. DSM 17811]
MVFSSWFKNRKIEIQKQAKIRTAKKVAIGAVAGSLSGLLGGLLFSPKSGKENREDIVKSSKDITNNIKEKTTELKDTIDSKVTDVKSSVTESKTKISEYLNGKKSSKDNATDDEISSK